MSKKVLTFVPGETENECLYRIGDLKTDGLYNITWEEIKDFMNEHYRESELEYYDESAYRKRYKAYADSRQHLRDHGVDTKEEIEELEKRQIEIAKERIKLRDERTDYQRSIREEARKESFIELIERTIAEKVEPLEYKSSPIIDSDDDMIIMLSDPHTGMDVDNFVNKFNAEILKERMEKYLAEIIKVQEKEKCRNAYLVLLGDNISGLIHDNLRLQNNEDVIKQLKRIITYIGDFVEVLSKHFTEVQILSVSGNHSRLSPDKMKNLKSENLDSLIPFCLNIKFDNYENVKVREDAQLDETICAFKTRAGRIVYAVHGDHDKLSTVTNKLSMTTGIKPDIILMGHMHHSCMDTVHNTKIVMSGSMIGTDDYCIDHRITGLPEQIFFITNGDRKIKCLYDVQLEEEKSVSIN